MIQQKIVEIYHEKGSKLTCPECKKACMVYDHLKERVLCDLDSLDFMNFIHPSSSRISCPEHGIKETLLSWMEECLKHDP